MKEYSDIFASGYEDLKMYDKSIIQHTITITQDQKAFKQKLRRANPLFLPLIEKEVRILCDAKIIVRLRLSKSLSKFFPITIR